MMPDKAGKETAGKKPDSFVLLIGCGNMGRALLDGWIARGHAPDRLAVIDPAVAALPAGVRRLAEAPDARPDAVVLAVKPQKIAEVAPLLARLDHPAGLLLSILASAPFATLRAAMPQARAIVRAVPNLPAAIGAGMTGLVADRDAPAARMLAEALCAPLGAVEWLADEAQCHDATALWGCGPAYVFRFADALVRAACATGMEAGLARRATVETLLGAARLLSERPESPAEQARRVCSPGGVTLAALEELDRDDGLTRRIARTHAAALRRSRTMTAETAALFPHDSGAAA